MTCLAALHANRLVTSHEHLLSSEWMPHFELMFTGSFESSCLYFLHSVLPLYMLHAVICSTWPGNMLPGHVPSFWSKCLLTITYMQFGTITMTFMEIVSVVLCCLPAPLWDVWVTHY